MILDPDYARIFTQARVIAWNYGYTCAEKCPACGGEITMAQDVPAGVAIPGKNQP